MTRHRDGRMHPRRDLALLVSGNTVSAFGNAVYLITATLLLKQLTGSPLVLGVFQFLALSPGFLLSPLIGAMIDRSSRRTLVIASDLYRGLVMAAAGIALFFPPARSAWLLLPVSLLAGIGHALFVPAAQALLPSIVSPERLPGATSLRAASTQLANLAGNAVGGALFVALGAPLVFLVNGATFVLSGLQERLIGPEARAGGTRSSLSILAAARTGLRAVRTDTPMIRLILSQAGLFALSPVLMLSLPFIVIDELGMSQSTVGLYFAVALAGGVAAFAGLRRPHPEQLLSWPVVPVSYTVLGGAFVAVSLTVSPVVIGLVAVVAGAAAAAVYLYATVWIQVTVASDLHGRYFALLEAASSLVAPLAYLGAGVLLEALGSSGRWVLFLSVGVLAASWAGCQWAQRGRRPSRRDG